MPHTPQWPPFFHNMLLTVPIFPIARRIMPSPAGLGDNGSESHRNDILFFRSHPEGMSMWYPSDLRRLMGQLAQFWPVSTPPQAPSAPGTTGSFPQIIAEAAQRYALPPSLLSSVMAAESGGNPSAVSPAGAMGLMQITAATAHSLGVTDPFDPTQNILAGAAYLRQMLDRFSSLPLALAAYNAGPAAVTAYGGIPPYAETKAYVQKVMGTYLDTHS